VARISGINIPLNKRVEIGLTYIYGIGRSTSNHLLAELGIEPDRKVRDLTEEEVIKLRELIDKDFMLVSWASPSPRAPGPRSEHQDERAHAQGPEADAGGRQEEGRQEVNASSS
jgi:ribosomal protein S13